MSVFNELFRLQQEMDSLLRRPGSEFFFGPSAAGVFPPVNVFRDTQGDLVIRAELPGVRPDDVTVTVEQRRLTISGERKAETPENGGYHRRERPWGKFSRSIQLPDDLDVERAEATFRNGVMALRVPRAEAAKPRQINVQVA
jgi:HSP20 family protein